MQQAIFMKAAKRKYVGMCTASSEVCAQLICLSEGIGQCRRAFARYKLAALLHLECGERETAVEKQAHRLGSLGTTRVRSGFISRGVEINQSG
jgi:hypothetical protein